MIAIDVDTWNVLAAYLESRPWREVDGILRRLRTSARPVREIEETDTPTDPETPGPDDA